MHGKLFLMQNYRIYYFRFILLVVINLVTYQTRGKSQFQVGMSQMSNLYNIANWTLQTPDKDWAKYKENLEGKIPNQ